MIKTLLIDPQNSLLTQLEEQININCPQINIIGKKTEIPAVEEFIDYHLINLVFINIDVPNQNVTEFLTKLAARGIEFIVISARKEMAYEALKFSATSFVLRSVLEKELIYGVKAAAKRIRLRQQQEQNNVLLQKINRKLSGDDLIGIPTMEGFFFIQLNDIIRCQGMQRCTLIYATDDRKFISSYNLGEFRKLLEPFDFFSPHKSHLINLRKICKYRREGTVLMTDGFDVPVSRRKKTEFLNQCFHI